jgi:hypothetical protein
MNAVEKVQAEGPASKSEADYNLWYDKILKTANAMYGHSVLIRGELDDEQGDAIGDYDPYTRTWSKEKHEKLVDLNEELPE